MTIENVSQLINILQNNKSVFITNEDVFIYENNMEDKTETLQTFKPEEIHTGFYKDIPVWLNFMLAKLTSLLPINMLPVDISNPDAIDNIRNNIDLITSGTLSEKQMRDLLGITTASNKEKEKKKESEIEDIIKKLRQGF